VSKIPLSVREPSLMYSIISAVLSSIGVFFAARSKDVDRQGALAMAIMVFALPALAGKIIRESVVSVPTFDRHVGDPTDAIVSTLPDFEQVET
jgi:hypothetical protein